MSLTRLIALVVLTLVAVGVALLLQRRRPDPPSAPSYRAPKQLDLDDFVSQGARLFVALFSSTTCDTCPRAWAAIEEVAAEHQEDEGFVVQRIDVQDDPALHERYRIDGVPTTIVADHQGVVVQAFFGPITGDQLREAVGPGDHPHPH